MIEYNFSTNLRKIRKEQGVTQNELARGIRVSQVTVSEWETNVRYPTVDRIYEIANFLKVPVNALLSDTQENDGKAY
ncbi:MAG: helix-turn-helix transcriptional regulator [Bacteroidales bacterium]|nr:helix-turn-helix transcriptional regulator [Candidatus Scybalousia scybalohippi]